MHTHNPNGTGHEPEEVDASKGYEPTDVRVTGVVVFLVALTVFVVVAAVMAYGIGKAVNAHMAREDGPTSRWSKTVDLRPLGNLPNNPQMQNKLEKLTEEFPEPRVQTDDGNQDVADLHAREDLLLENYSWAGNGPDGKPRVRIPIERAMQLVAQRGLPQAPQATHSALMTGEQDPAVVPVPLTGGFARTGYELEQAAAKKSRQ
ncbi:MAG: hypothetical protein WCE75_13800 [Terracidiphilus sp.]